MIEDIHRFEAKLQFYSFSERERFDDIYPGPPAAN